jgi:hypothetical protein
MGVTAIPITEAFEADLTKLEAYPRVTGRVAGQARFGYTLDTRTNKSFVAINRLLSSGHRLLRVREPLAVAGASYPPGAVVVLRQDGLSATMAQLAEELGLEVLGVEARPDGDLGEIRQPRIGLYKSWVVEWVDGWTASEGWTRFLLDQYEFPYVSLSNADVRAGELRSRLDVIVIPSQDLSDIISGYRAGRRQFGVVHQNLPPPEYQGGIDAAGVNALRRFVEAGGTLVLVDRATDLATVELGLPVQNVLGDLPQEQFFGPGSIVGITADPTHPIAYGMKGDAAGYFRKSRAFAFDTTAARIRSVARYASRDLLKSGWLVGDEYLAGKEAVLDIPLGAGRVVLLGFPAYFRAQPHGTFKLLFNSLFLRSGT